MDPSCDMCEGCGGAGGACLGHSGYESAIWIYLGLSSIGARPLPLKVLGSSSIMDMNEGIWSSYSRRAVADGMIDRGEGCWLAYDSG